MCFSGFGLQLFEEISRVKLGNCFSSQRFMHMGFCKASSCPTDTHSTGRGLLSGMGYNVLSANWHRSHHFYNHPVWVLLMCFRRCSEHKSEDATGPKSSSMEYISGSGQGDDKHLNLPLEMDHSSAAACKLGTVVQVVERRVCSCESSACVGQMGKALLCENE